MSLDINNIDLMLLTKAVNNIGFNKSFSIVDGVLDTYGETDFPADDDIENELNRLEAEANSVQYQEDRKNEYPSIGDQLDALFHAGLFPEEMTAKIQAVKDKYPKPENN